MSTERTQGAAAGQLTVWVASCTMPNAMPPSGACPRPRPIGFAKGPLCTLWLFPLPKLALSPQGAVGIHHTPNYEVQQEMAVRSGRAAC